MTDLDDAILADIFAAEGSSPIAWERASRCTCTTPDTKQPVWGCPQCAGSGVIYAAPQTITGLFRSQSRWLSFREQGEFAHGEAQLTVPWAYKPGYVDRRVRDRYTILDAGGSDTFPEDSPEQRVFFPAATPVPFNFTGIGRAWRVQLQARSQENLLVS